MAAGKCPHCESLVTKVRVNAVPGSLNARDTFHCVTYACNSCNTVLGAQIDPVAIKNDILNKLGGK